MAGSHRYDSLEGKPALKSEKKGQHLKRIIVLTFVAASVRSAHAQGGNLFDTNLYYETVVEGLALPTSFEFVGDGTILALQKMDGRVRIVKNCAIMGTALDLSVSNMGEMGLLGIVKHPDFDLNRVVYIYYTSAATDGGSWDEDRVETYRWDPALGTLTFIRRIMTFAREGYAPTQYHHGGYIKVGPDRKLYIQHGDMFTRFFKMEINDDTGNSGNNASIYRLNLDGSIPADNPFASHPIANIQKIFVYGMRNGFGMSFDPLTNILWYTENGPEQYDEINLALPGLNSGWHKIMGPDSRNALLDYNKGVIFNESDLVMFPGAHYSDPEFSYKMPIGITFIEFLASPKFPPEYQDRVIVGCTAIAKIFLFQLDEERSGFILSEFLEDKVADNSREVDTNMIGNGWGPVVDGKIGPDGYFYLSGLGSGSIFRIRPVDEQVVPTTLNVVRGIFNGGLPELITSDDHYLLIRPGATFSSEQAPGEIEVKGFSAFEQPDSMSFRAELSGTSTAIQCRISLFNYTLNQFEVLSELNLPLGDTEFTVPVNGITSDYINPRGGDVKAKLAFKALGPTFAFPWQVRIDRLSWSTRKPA